MRAGCVRSRHFNSRQPSGLNKLYLLLLGGGGGAYARDKNTSARLCAKNAGGAYVRGEAYLWDTTVVCKNQKIVCTRATLD